MNSTLALSRWVKPSLALVLGLAVILGLSLSVQAEQALKFTAVEKEGKIWEGGGTIDGKSPLTLTVSNPLTADHGFAIDSMKVKELLKPGETKTITVPVENIDKNVSEHRVYCQLHPKHAPATIKVAK
jgi:hypothetical protein